MISWLPGTYVITSVVVHLGERTSEGHYMNLMFDDGLNCWLSADDGNEAARGSSGDMRKVQTDSYVLMCNRVHNESS